jgi:hypothetical protein
MESEGESSSDDSLAKPAPIPTHLFHNGPITSRAFRAACERTPAQPRRSRGGQLRAFVLGEERLSSSTMIQEMRPVQTHPVLEQMPYPIPVETPVERPASISVLPPSQDSDINRSPESTPEPGAVDEIDETNTSATRVDQLYKMSARGTSTTLASSTHARLFATKKKVKKGYIGIKPSAITRKISPMISDSETAVNMKPPKKRRRKRRRLPMENELVMVPVLGIRETQETVVHADSDPIEETQIATPVETDQANQTSSQSRRRPLRSIERNLRLPVQNKNPNFDPFSFRALKHTLPSTKSSLKDLAREGFEDHELVLPPRSQRKKLVFRGTHISLPSLPLINTRDLKELPITSSLTTRRDKKIHPTQICFAPLVLGQSKKLRLSTPESAIEATKLVEAQGDTDMTPQDSARVQPVIQLKHVSTRPRLASLRDEIHSQLINVTAPKRESSESEEEFEASDSYGSDFEPECDHSDREEFEEMDLVQMREESKHGTELDDIEDEALLLETTDVDTIISMGEEVEVNDECEDDLTRPGQLSRMKSNGRLIEVPEDCIETPSSSNSVSSNPRYMAHGRNFVAKSSSMQKPRKSILKSIIPQFLASFFMVLTCSLLDHTDASQSQTSQLGFQSIYGLRQCAYSRLLMLILRCDR